MPTRRTTSTTPPRLTTTQYAVLGLVAYRECSGYDLAQGAARGIGYIWGPSRSQIYKVLRQLGERGLVRSRAVEQQGRPDKALYRITARGRSALARWIEEVEDEPTGGPSIFLLKTLFAWTAPPEAGLAQLDAYQRYLERTVAHFEELAHRLPADEPVHSLVALRHGIARGRTTLRWIEEAREVLRRGANSAARSAS